MFNTEIYFSTFIYILIIILLIIIVSIKTISFWKRRDRSYHLKFLGLLCSALIYNIVEGLLPDKYFGINLISQNIFAWIIGLGVAYHYFIFTKIEYGIVLLKKISFSLIGMLALLSLIILFILPYTITGSLLISRFYFLSFFLILLLLAEIIVIDQQLKKLKSRESILFKIHDFNGIIAFSGLISLPITILIFGDNQFIEQTFFTMGFFIITIDYFLYELRKKEIKKNISFEQLTVREAEILNLLLENPDLKYAELSQILHISEKTLSTHLSNIYKKIGIKNKQELREISKSNKNILNA